MKGVCYGKPTQFGNDNKWEGPDIPTVGTPIGTYEHMGCECTTQNERIKVKNKGEGSDATLAACSRHCDEMGEKLCIGFEFTLPKRCELHKAPGIITGGTGTSCSSKEGCFRRVAKSTVSVETDLAENLDFQAPGSLDSAFEAPELNEAFEADSALHFDQFVINVLALIGVISVTAFAYRSCSNGTYSKIRQSYDQIA